MRFDRALSTFTMTSIKKKNIEYFNYRSKIQLDHTVPSPTARGVEWVSQSVTKEFLR